MHHVGLRRGERNTRDCFPHREGADQRITEIKRMHQSQRVRFGPLQRIVSLQRFLLVEPDVLAVQRRTNLHRTGQIRRERHLQRLQNQPRFGCGEYDEPGLFLGNQAQHEPVRGSDSEQVAQQVPRKILQTD